MDEKVYDMGPIDIAWCPGCGNYPILKILKDALAELEVDPKNLVMVSGIGQAAKIPHYLKCHVFNGLHGRAIPPATGIKASNPELTVIAESGDGDMYGEGGNHLLHAIRRNPNTTAIVHNNMVYGLTKGQASPTSQIGFKTPVQVDGVFEEAFNPITLAIAMDCSFVARAYCGDAEQTAEIFKKAIQHNGFALVDVFQPCVSFNKTNTYQWFKEKIYYLDGPLDREEAFRKSQENEKLPLGIFYINNKRTAFEDNLSGYANNKDSLYKRVLDSYKLADLIKSKKE
jgi:2-oxoglutarate ferredoxin oxidoreductase subunit beta